MTEKELQGYEIFDLYDILAKARVELATFEVVSKNNEDIKQKKEYILRLQNVIALKRLGM